MNPTSAHAMRPRLIRAITTPRVPRSLSQRFGQPSREGREAILTLLEADWKADGSIDLPSGHETPEQMLATLEARTDRHRRLVIPWLHATCPLEGLRILDVGCGTGASLLPLVEQGAQVIGVDRRADSLRVTQARLDAQDLSAELIQGTFDPGTPLLPDRSFDMILFWASLEHMPLSERLAAMRDTWRRLSPGGLWGIIDTPNRLWYFDEHSSRLPFFHWLPTPLATIYAKHSPRPSCQALADNPQPDALVRYGRSVSFHECSVALEPAETLHVVSCLDAYLRKHNLPRGLRWYLSRKRRYARFLHRFHPKIPPAFFEESLQLLIQK